MQHESDIFNMKLDDEDFNAEEGEAADHYWWLETIIHLVPAENVPHLVLVVAHITHIPP
jgi:hypothetical protein